MTAQMDQPLRLHYAPDNASLCVRLALATLDWPYQTVLVDRAAMGQRAAPFLRLNPNGLIPVLETPDGPLFETGAILLYLADQRPGVIFPAMGDPHRGRALTWAFWLANTLHPALRMLFYPARFMLTDPAGLRAQTRLLLADHLAVLEHADAPLMIGDRLTLHGCYTAPMLRWCALYGGAERWLRLANYPRLHRFAAAAEATSQALELARAEGLGPTCFSDPVLPDPPEGSAT